MSSKDNDSSKVYCYLTLYATPEMLKQVKALILTQTDADITRQITKTASQVAEEKREIEALRQSCYESARRHDELMKETDRLIADAEALLRKKPTSPE
jgi:hypothetical protein